jgi:glycosyltransferase involved in cell wall biosynthesis
VLVGIVGRLTEVKNHRLFLDAAARLKAASEASGARVRFLVVGDGHLRAGLEAYARASGLTAADVTFTGTRHDPENFYAALDVVALTSLNEGTPLTLIEAMAAGRAVAATAVGGVVDLLGAPRADTEGGAGGYEVCERGLRVRSGDAGGFGAALGRLAADEGLRRELGARGRAHVEANYSVARLVADVTKLYEELFAPAGAAGERGREEKWDRLSSAP